MHSQQQVGDAASPRLLVLADISRLSRCLADFPLVLQLLQDRGLRMAVFLPAKAVRCLGLETPRLGITLLPHYCGPQSPLQRVFEARCQHSLCLSATTSGAKLLDRLARHIAGTSSKGTHHGGGDADFNGYALVLGRLLWCSQGATSTGTQHTVQPVARTSPMPSFVRRTSRSLLQVLATDNLPHYKCSDADQWLTHL